MVILILLVFSISQLSFRKQEDIKTQDISSAQDAETQGTFSTWDAETGSLKRYTSYEEMEQENNDKREKELEEYNKAIKGTIVEQVKNAEIPSYWDKNQLAQLQDGEVVVYSQKSDDFPDGFLLWVASLVEGVNFFTVGDFNSDGQEDVAHVIGYSGGGSGFFIFLLFL